MIKKNLLSGSPKAFLQLSSLEDPCKQPKRQNKLSIKLVLCCKEQLQHTLVAVGPESRWWGNSNIRAKAAKNHNCLQIVTSDREEIFVI